MGKSGFGIIEINVIRCHYPLIIENNGNWVYLFKRYKTFMKLFFLLICFLICTASYACKCKRVNSIVNEFDSVDYVIVGKVLSIDTINVLDSNQIKNPPNDIFIYELPRPNIQVAHYKIEITKTYKGVTTESIVSVYSAPDDETCGYVFKLGLSYIIYGFSNPVMHFDDSADYHPPQGENKIWVTRCGRTKVKNDKEINILESL